MTQSVNMCAFKFKNVFLLVALLILARDVIVDVKLIYLFFFLGGGVKNPFVFVLSMSVY